MTASLGHRGPDGQGFFVEKNIGLGHRRLSIIDLVRGEQPMQIENGNLSVVFNGEIYNFVELRAELEEAGATFRTSSDTEVILHAYRRWGADCVKKFNGMFAFAIWDRQTEALFLARDHLGVKPLYYAFIGGSFAFASEIKALLKIEGCPRECNLNSLAELFTFRYVPSPGTLFLGISKLLPGHSMNVTRQTVALSRYWNAVPKIQIDVPEEELITQYQYLLEDAVRLQLRSDVPIGLFLSSGVDSGVLLAIMSEHTSRRVQTFTLGFCDGERTNEVSDARVLADKFGAEHCSELVNCHDYLTYFERYMSDLEEPVAHEPAPAFYFLSKLTRQGVKVALTGQGADEPWAGYDRYIGVKLSSYYSKLPRAITCGLASLVQRVPGRLEKVKRGVLSLSEPDVLTRFAKIYSFFSEDMKEQLYKGALKDLNVRDGFSTKDALFRLQNDVRHLDPLTQMLYIDTRASLPDDLLMVADKMSMANSLEVRVPFLDYRLVEFIESIPVGLKLKGVTAKYLHKRAVRKWLPNDIIYRRKKGFAHPIDRWLQSSMLPFVKECLLSKETSISRYFDQTYISRLIKEHEGGREQWMRHLYLLLSLELWHRSYISS